MTCAALAHSHFGVTFEEAAEALNQLERMFAEMDGSFVWTGQNELSKWQVDGMLYDRLGKLHRVELKGSCPRSHWQLLLATFGWPQQAIVVHLLELQCFVELKELLEFLE